MSKEKTIDISSIQLPGDTSIYKTNQNNLYDNKESNRLGNIILIPLNDEVFFPYLLTGAVITDSKIIASVKKAFRDNETVMFYNSNDIDGLSLHIDPDNSLVGLGSVGVITEIRDSDDGSLSYNAVMSDKARITSLRRKLPYMRGDVELLFPELIEPTKEEKKLGSELEKQYGALSQFLNDHDKHQLNEILSGFPKDSIRRLYFMIQNSPLKPQSRIELYSYNNLSETRRRFLELLKEESEAIQIKAELHHKTMAEMGQRQREEILRTQLRQIKQELGEDSDSDEEELQLRAAKKIWSEKTQAHFQKELRKLMRYNPTSPDYAIQYSYLDTFLNLPWAKCDNSDFTLQSVENILNRDHYGLEKVKERIIEQMAVHKLRGDFKAPILCLYGPPGVGKTSLGKSVAEALGRQYVRVALGGLHDESEIRGHRRTYLGSMPGRILSALERCGTSDPVMVLDEIDKIGTDYKGDPSQALLEVLDPEQNFKFHDNYIDFDYDLSKVLFIATANTLQTISKPLLDRMELIEITGYAEPEKIEIAQRHIISKSLKEHGFQKDEIKFENKALQEIIEYYTRESGVRQLEKKINEILRKLARMKVSEDLIPLKIDVSSVEKYLGKKEVFSNKYENNDCIGVVTGLAWTQAGGDILFIESAISPGKEQTLTLTGNLGDVMKESAILALQYIKSHQKEIGIEDKAMEFGTVHVHVPEGAVPKDGPSAGITILTSLASAFTGRKVKSHIAMTGELTLSGRVLPVGGIKEKILAAKRAGIRTVIMSSKNEKDVKEIKPDYIADLNFIFVDSASDVLDNALL